MKLQSSRRFVSSSNAQASLQMWSDLRQTDYLLWFLRARGRHVSRVTITTRWVNIETSPWWFKYFEWKLISTVQSSTFCDKATLHVQFLHMYNYIYFHLLTAAAAGCEVFCSAELGPCSTAALQHCSRVSAESKVTPQADTRHLSLVSGIKYRAQTQQQTHSGNTLLD